MKSIQYIRTLVFMSVFVGVLGVVIFVSGVFSDTQAQGSIGEDYTAIVAPELITSAGFTDIQKISPTENSFLPPNQYFRVSGFSGTSEEWGVSYNILAILIIPKQTPSWEYNEGEYDIRDIFGKTQVRFSTSRNYIVVTGPDHDKIVRLAELLRAQY